jgi:hypothetical protein
MTAGSGNRRRVVLLCTLVAGLVVVAGLLAQGGPDDSTSGDTSGSTTVATAAPDTRPITSDAADAAQQCITFMTDMVVPLSTPDSGLLQQLAAGADQACAAAVALLGQESAAGQAIAGQRAVLTAAVEDVASNDPVAVSLAYAASTDAWTERMNSLLPG